MTRGYPSTSTLKLQENESCSVVERNSFCHQQLRVNAALQVDSYAQAGKVGLVADVGDFAHLSFFRRA